MRPRRKYHATVLGSIIAHRAFSPIVGGYRQGRLPWHHPKIYPIEKELFPGTDASSDAPLVVDVAGGLGHDIDEFKRNYPNHPGVSSPIYLSLPT